LVKITYFQNKIQKKMNSREERQGSQPIIWVQSVFPNHWHLLLHCQLKICILLPTHFHYKRSQLRNPKCHGLLRKYLSVLSFACFQGHGFVLSSMRAEWNIVQPGQDL
jgi:hypothetical protein